MLTCWLFENQDNLLYYVRYRTQLFCHGDFSSTTALHKAENHLFAEKSYQWMSDATFWTTLTVNLNFWEKNFTCKNGHGYLKILTYCPKHAWNSVNQVTWKLMILKDLKSMNFKRRKNLAKFSLFCYCAQRQQDKTLYNTLRINAILMRHITESSPTAHIHFDVGVWTSNDPLVIGACRVGVKYDWIVPIMLRKEA